MRVFVVATLAAWLGLAISGALAAFIHPKYPQSGPPEFLAMFYLVPGYVSGMLGLLFLRHFPLNSAQLENPLLVLPKRLLCSGILSSVTVLITLYFVTVMPAHRALPWTAKEVQESYWGEALRPDYQYCLKARIDEKDFPAYVAKFGLQQYSRAKAAPVAWPHIPGDTEATWWQPPRFQRSITYGVQNGDHSVIAAFKDGWLYVAAQNH